MRPDAERIAAVALAEDGETDVTTSLTVPVGLEGEARIEYRSGGVVAGAPFADAVARACECRIDWRVPDGRVVPPGTVTGVCQADSDPCGCFTTIEDGQVAHAICVD